jgi:hypothetical protein
MKFGIFNRIVENTETNDYKDRLVMIRNSVCNEMSLRKIIGDILHIKGDFCVKLRFCQAVSKFEKETNPLEKKNKSLKIVSLFIHGEMFKIKSLTKKRVNMILRNHNNLILAKEDIIREIEKCDDLMQIIEKHSS